MEAKQENVEAVQKPNHEAETISTDDDKIGLLEDFPLDQVMIGFILFYFCVCLFGVCVGWGGGGGGLGGVSHQLINTLSYCATITWNLLMFFCHL